MRLLRRLWYLLRLRRFEADLSEEIEFHRAMKHRELEDHGVAPPAAALAAQRAFGSGLGAREQARDVWLWRWLQDIGQDVRFAGRLFARDRRFALSAVLALTLGIAANTTIFTFINTALFKDLPFDEPERLVAIGTIDAHVAPPRPRGASFLDLQDWRAATRAFDGLAADAGATMNMSDTGRAPERFRGAYVSSNIFAVLRVRPLIGRPFSQDDERPGAAPVVMLGHRLWQDWLGADPSAVGRTIRVNDVPTIVVGVMPAAFRFPGTAEAWQPLSLMPGLASAKRDARTLNITGRLADTVTLDHARAELTAIADHLAVEHPTTNRNVGVTIAPPLESIRRSLKPILMTLLGAVAFLLLIACANVANMLLARATTRSRELAIRASLGATRWRIVRQLLLESVVLASIAGILGLILAVWGVRYFGVGFNVRDFSAPDRAAAPYWVDLTMDARVFAFVATICLGTSIFFGLAPAVHVSKTDVIDALKQSGHTIVSGARARRWAGSLMVFELTLTLILLSGAGLLVRSFVSQYRTELVIDPTNFVTARLALSGQRYATLEAQRAFVERLQSRLGTDTALAAATIASDVPLVSLGGISRQLTIEGRPQSSEQARPAVSYITVGDRYLETLGLRLTRGRAFTADETAAGRAVAIVNQRFATLFFSDSEPIGRRVRLDPPEPGAVDASPPWFTIVGVTQTLPQFMAPQFAPEPVVIVPVLADSGPIRFVSMLVRGRSGTREAVDRLRHDVSALDADLPVFAVQTMDDMVARTRDPVRVIGSLFALLALNALLVASVGLFALTAHSVAQRTPEIGVRLALGARRAQVTWLFVRRTLGQLALGLTLGLAGALSVGRLLGAYLEGVSPRDPVTLASVVTLLIVVSLIASFLPALRAAGVDPATALRHE
jgi:predicted permease